MRRITSFVRGNSCISQLCTDIPSITDDPAIFKNAPVCVQVVGRTLEEEAVIGMAEIVDAALRSSGAKL
jgi:Asp-tRNA(Asn)/Glu-tRNA(Gln) amidotransferase A subunit family amidase